VKGDGRQGSNILSKGCCHVDQGGNGIVAVSQVLGFTRGMIPSEVEEEIGAFGDYPLSYFLGAVR